MFAVIQFPIADTRIFAPGPAIRLNVPDFPDPKTWGNPQFVSSFGSATERRLDPDPAWFDEGTYCRANRAVRFVDFSTQRLGGDMQTFIPRKVVRRLFSDGDAVARVEIGMAIRRPGPTTVATDQSLMVAACLDFLRLPTRSPAYDEVPPKRTSSIADQPTVPLVEQGPRLARLYGRSTGNFKAASSDVIDQFVEDGRPLAIFEFDEQEMTELPPGLRVVDPDKVYGAKVGFTWLESGDKPDLIGSWFIIRGKHNRDILRNLRLCLLRIHAERQTLDIVMRQIHRKRVVFEPKSAAGDSLEEYFNRVTKILNRPQAYGVSQSAILEAYDAAESVLPMDETGLLLQKFENARNQVMRKVVAYQVQSRVVTSINVEPGGTMTLNHNQVEIGNLGQASFGDNSPVSGNPVILSDDAQVVVAPPSPEPANPAKESVMKPSTIIVTIVILGFGLAGFLFLPISAAVLWLIFMIVAYPLALSFTRARPLEGADLLEMYKIGVKQVPIIGKLFAG